MSICAALSPGRVVPVALLPGEQVLVLPPLRALAGAGGEGLPPITPSVL